MAKKERDWAQQLDQQQQEVQQWQEESLMLLKSLDEKTEQLEEALQREQGLQSSLTSLQHQLDSHAHRITIPSIPLVSPLPCLCPTPLAKSSCCNIET